MADSFKDSNKDANIYSHRARKIVNAALAAVSSIYPAFGFLAGKSPWIEVKNPAKCDTMATDGVHYYYYAPFVVELFNAAEQKKSGSGLDTIVFVVIHEAMHNSLNHFDRHDLKIDGKKWNIAADFEINHLIDGMLGVSGAKNADTLHIPPGTVGSPEFYAEHPDHEKLKQLIGSSAEKIFINLPKDEKEPSEDREFICPIFKSCPLEDPSYYSLPDFKKSAKEMIDQVKRIFCPFCGEEKYDNKIDIPPYTKITPSKNNVDELRQDNTKERVPFGTCPFYKFQDGESEGGSGKTPPWLPPGAKKPVDPAPGGQRPGDPGDPGDEEERKRIKKELDDINKKTTSGKKLEDLAKKAGEILKPGEIKQEDVADIDREIFSQMDPSKLSNKELEDIKKSWREEKIKQLQRHAGTGSYNRLLEELIKQEMYPPTQSWKNLLRQFLNESLNKTKKVYLKRRQYVTQGEYFRRNIRDISSMETVVVAVDTSGSIVSDPGVLSEFVNEIVHALTSYPVSEAYIIYCEESISNIVKYNQKQLKQFTINKSAFKQKISKDAAGGGGTSFVPPFIWVKKNKIEPTCFIYLTDGEGTFPANNLVNFPTIWVISNDRKRIIDIPPSLGKKIDIFTSSSVPDNSAYDPRDKSGLNLDNSSKKDESIIYKIIGKINKKYIGE